jgi:hypothetical protein
MFGLCICYLFLRNLLKGSLGAAVKLLPYNHEVMGSSPENSLLHKCMKKLHKYDPKWLDPFRDSAQVGARAPDYPFYINICIHHSIIVCNLIILLADTLDANCA